MVLERRCNGRHVETKISGPFLTSFTKWRRAITVVVAGTSARVIHAIDLSTQEHTCEVDSSQSGHGDVPDSVDVEQFGVILLHWVGVSVGAAINHREAIKSGELGDHNVVIGIRLLCELGYTLSEVKLGLHSVNK